MADEPKAARAAHDPFETMRTIEAAALAGPAAAAQVPALAALIGSRDHAHRYYNDHALIGEQAAYAIRQIGVAPDIELLRRLLADPRLLNFPVASYDQGTYVGDYATRNVAPAGLAALLVPLMGAEGSKLFRELAMNATSPHDEIAAPAQAAIDQMLDQLTGEEEPQLLDALRKAAARMNAEAASARASRGVERLREIAKACLKRLDEI